MKFKPYLVSILIIVLGVIFTLFLQSKIPGEYFFSGDEGIKALLVRQFSSGNFHINLELPAEPWIKELWSQGLYPFKPPFAYQLSEKYYITFPFTFPLLTTPFYSALGWRGLYIIPLLSTWAIWLRFYQVSKYLNLGFITTNLSLTAIVFASNLSIYSGLFWEHNFAVFLAFYGVTNLLISDTKYLSSFQIILSGILIGVSTWFRGEMLCLVAIITGLLIVSFFPIPILNKIQILPQKKILFLSTMMGTVLIFLGINYIIYGTPFGIHSLQVVDTIPLKSRLIKVSQNFHRLREMLFEYFPITFFAGIYLIISLVISGFTRKWKIPQTVIILAVISGAFLVLINFVLPSMEGINLFARTGGKQWGPRFLLILIPLISLLAAFGIKSSLDVKKYGLKYFTIGIFVIFLVLGINTNLFPGSTYLIEEWREAETGLKFIYSHPHNLLATSSQLVAQNLDFRKKQIVRTETQADLEKLVVAMTKNTENNRFIYDCYSCKNIPNKRPENFSFNQENINYKLEFTEIFQYKRNIIYEVEVTQET